MEIRLEAASRVLRLEAQRMAGAAGDPIINIGTKRQYLPALIVADLKLDGQEGRVGDDDPAFLDRRDQKILVALALEHRGKQLPEPVTADPSLQVEPCPVARDSHVEIAAERRIP